MSRLATYNLSKELSKNFLKKLKNNQIVENKKFMRFQTLMLLEFEPNYKRCVRFRSFCNFTRKPRANIREFKSNGLFVKEKSGKFLFIGINRSS